MLQGASSPNRLVKQASEFPRIVGIFTSPYIRSIQTVVPLAKATALEPQLADALSESRQMEEGADFVRRMVFAAASSGGGSIVICGHGGLEHALGLHDEGPFRKGAVWVFRGDNLSRPVRKLQL